MTRLVFVVAVLLLLLASGAGSADTPIYAEGTYTNTHGTTYRWLGGYDVHVDAYSHSAENFRNTTATTPNCQHASAVQFRDSSYSLKAESSSGYVTDITCDTNPNPAPASMSGNVGHGWYVIVSRYSNYLYCYTCAGGDEAPVSVTFSSEDIYTVSGSTACLDNVTLYIHDGSTYQPQNYSTLGSSYSFPIFENHDYTLVFSNGAYYDFTCTGDEVFDYDVCIWVYGYTCGVDSVKLYKDDGGWVLDDSVGQSTGYDVYEMQILSGEDYKISFIDSTIDGDFVVHNQTFSCTGDHVLIDFDRCEWVYPPNGPDIPIYLWTGYDYNVVVFKDNHGNMVENAELAVYDTTDDTYIQKWTGNEEGYALLGAKFNTDHDVLMMLRTFDGVFTLATTYPANGSALVGEEDITTTNWTIPIKYNLNILPVDQYAVQLFDVFCGLAEYTPLNPQAFWGMDLSDRGYVPVTNCSGFAMCDIIAEKEGYTDYKVEALNWTSKSALVKDYRHNIVMEESINV